MAKVDLGEKRICPECGSKFYDLTKRPAVCPKCNFTYDPDELEALVGAVPPTQLKPENEAPSDDDVETDEDMDEEEAETRELELDGDDAALLGSAGGDNDDSGMTPDFNTFDPDEDEDQDAALVADDDEDDLPPTGDDDEDDAEEIEL